jgi:hypothetical protein
VRNLLRLFVAAVTFGSSLAGGTAGAATADDATAVVSTLPGSVSSGSPTGGKLTAPDASPDDLFGTSTAVDGDTAVVGAPGDDTRAGDNAGSAWVFVRSSTGWRPQAKLIAPDGAAEDQFGFSVALDGDTAVVGAFNDDTAAGENAGSAWVFVRSGTTWRPEAKLTAPDGDTFDFFGVSVALDGYTALVGAYFDDTRGGTEAGSAYVFVRSSTGWRLQAKLTAPDGAPDDFFGISAALDGNSSVVGADGDDTRGGTEAGSAYVFVRSSTGWRPQAKLTAPNGSTDDGFGTSVDIDGDTVVAESSGEDTSAGIDAGAAYVFARSGATWSHQARLTAPGARALDLFGTWVAVEGDVAAVGAPGTDTPAGLDMGSVYGFVGSGTTWTARAKVTAPDAAPDDQFGISVAVSGSVAVIGAWQDDTRAGMNAGSAYVLGPT